MYKFTEVCSRIAIVVLSERVTNCANFRIWKAFPVSHGTILVCVVLTTLIVHLRCLSFLIIFIGGCATYLKLRKKCDPASIFSSAGGDTFRVENRTSECSA